ncbi:sarcosine oxidase subunit gamma [Sedimentitalea sp. HM32M-2]|uniref:sarcosine oxidase subunit gamma n=1 Tax=Sedimentitalea sp. HM32M-2 TaxID=3351566 RepID=UPI00362974F5
MSEPVSALNGARYDGIAQIQEIGLQGMITLRGDLSSKDLKSAASAVAGVAMPGVNEANCEDSRGLCWMSPDELLVLCPYDVAQANVTQLQQALADSHALAVNVSDARAVFRVTGPAAREVMAKLCPADLSPETFGPGMFRRSRLAQVPAAFWMMDEQSFQIVCFRSVADYVFSLLKAAAQPGSEVGYF